MNENTMRSDTASRPNAPKTVGMAMAAAKMMAEAQILVAHENETVTITMRKIDNGWMVKTVDGVDSDDISADRFKTTERFYATRPKVTITTTD